jgi:hypothetical protein
MNLPFKYGVFIILIIFFNYCCNLNSYSKASCDKTDFHDNNNLNDTGKVIFVDRVVFDTTANRFFGHIIDSLTRKPVAKAYVLITKDSKEFIVSTNVKGEFTFFKNGFSGKWQMLIRDATHRCLWVNNINIQGGLSITVKLSSFLN